MSRPRRIAHGSHRRHHSGWMLVALLVLGLAGARLDAAVVTWTGGSGSDPLWSNGTNWSTGAPPGAGDQLVFDGNAVTTNTNDLAPGTAFASLTINATAGDFIIGGAAITLNGGAAALTSNRTSGTITLSLPITFSTAAPTITRATGGTLIISNGIDNGGFLLTTTGGGTLTISGPISGSGGLTKAGAGLLVLSGAGSYTGTTTVSTGIVRVDADVAPSTNGPFGNSAAAIILAGGDLQVNTAVFSRSLSVTSGPSSLAAYGAARTVAAPIAIAAGVEATTASFVAANLNVSQDDWRVSQTIAGTRVDTLINQGSSAFGSASERAAWGIGGSDGDWNNFAVQWDGWLRIPRDGTNLFTRSDDGSRLTLINPTTGAVMGWTSNGWGAGQSGTTRQVATNLSAGLYRYRIQYTDGTGGNEARLLWSDAINGSPGFATGVTAGPTLPIIPSVFFGGFAVGNATDDLTLSGVISGAGSLTKIGGNTLILTASNTYTGATAIAAGTLRNGGTAGVIADASNVLVGTGATYDLNNLNETVGAIAGGGTIALGSAVLTSGANGNASTTVTGVITGTGSLVKNGSGALTLSGNNTFSGGITITNGYIAPTVAGGLGTGTLTVAGGGNASALRVGGAVTIPNPLVYTSGGVSGRGAFEANGVSATLSGPITINASTNNGGHFAANGGGVLTVGGAVASSVTVTVRIGTVVFSGGGTGYAAMSVNEGTVRVGAVDGIATSAVIDLGTTTNTTLDLNGFNQTLAGLQRTTTQTTTVTSATAATLTLNQTANLAYGGAITGAVNLVKNGSGSTTLSGTNTYTGTTTVSGGTLVVGSAAALGNVSAGTTVEAGANLTIAGVAVNAEPLVLNGSGIASAGALIGTGTASHAGTVTLASRAGIGSSGTLTLSGVLGDGGGVIGFDKVGTGTVILTGANTYTGTTTVAGGTLLVNGNGAGATGAVTVASGAVLGGTGTIGGVVTVAAGGMLSPGSAGAATVTVAHAGTALNLSSGSQSAFTLGTASDAINATGAAATVTLGGDLVVTAGPGFAAGNYTLVTTTGGVNGSFANVSFIPAVYGGVIDTTTDPTRAVLTTTYLVNPTVQTNTGLTLVNSTAATITSSHLSVTDAEQGAAALTYTMSTAPVAGVLRLNLVALGVGGTFTQDDINNNRLSYEHSAPASLADTFTFTVSDGAGGAIGATGFAITATGPGLTSGLVGYWPFDQVVGTTSPERTGAINPANLQAATTLAAGRFGNAFNSGGTTTTNAIINRPVQDDFSIVFWFRTAATGLGGVGSQWYSGRGLVDGEIGGTTNDFGVTLTGTVTGTLGVAAGTGNTDVTVTAPGAHDNNAWHQVAFTRTRSTGALSLKVDQGAAYTATGGTQALGTPTTLRLGALQTNVNHFTGQIDDVRFYNRVLSAAEQQALYTLSTGTKPVLGNLDGDGVSATEDVITALDLGGNVTLSDSDDLLFGGGYVLVENVSGGATSSLVIATANGIATSGSNVTYGGTVFGTIDGTQNGAAGVHLKVTLTTAAATNAAVTALLRSLSYLDTYGTPTARTVRVAVNDGFQICDAATVTVTVSAVADGPTVSANNGISVGAGTVKALTTAMLDFSDPEYAAAQITLAVATAPVHGFLRRSGVALAVGGSFTLAELASGIITYEHGDLANASDSVVLTPSDPSTTVANITFAITATGAGLSSGLLGHWRFNESATTLVARDSTGRGFAGALTNMAGTEWGAGQLGNALTLDGTNDVVTVPSGISVANSSFTLAGWTRRSVAGTADFLFGQGTGATSQGLHLGFMADNRLRLGFWGNDLDTGAAYTDTTAWHHVAAVHNSTTRARAIWRDGVSVASGTASANYGGSGVLQLGRGGPSGASEFSGQLDDLRIYGRDLSNEELAFLGSTPGAAPTIANLDGDTVTYTEESAAVRLDAGTAAVVADADDLTLAGGTVFVDNLTGNATTTLSVLNVGTITVSGATVSHLGSPIATIDGTVDGTAGKALRLSLTTIGATPAAVAALVQAIGIADSASGTRTLRVSVSDGVGSSGAMVTVSITPVNDLPVLAANTGIGAPVGGVAVIDNTALRTTDEDNTAAQLTYTVTAIPTHGHLRLNLVALTVGSTFTQDDIDNRRVSYEHGTIAQPSDSFSASLSDGSGGTIPTTTVMVTIGGTGLAQGLAARWSLDATSGTVATDGSGNANTGTVLNGTWSAGRLNNGLTLVGTGQVTTPNSATLDLTSAISVSGWVRTAQVGGSSILRHNGHFTALQVTGAGTAQVAYWTGGTLRTYPFPWNNTWNTNTWVHYTATYDQAAGLAIYFNGTLAYTSTAFLGALGAATEPFMLGATSGGGERFNGQIDEVRVYNRALPANEVRVLAQQAVPVLANLGGDAPVFSEDGGAVALDSGTAAGVSDADDADFGGGWLLVHGTNPLPADTLSVLDGGNGAGQIGVSGATVSYGGAVIGGIDVTNNGVAGADLRITFSTSAATPAAVTALVQALRFSTAGQTPDATSRVLLVTLNDNLFTSSVATVTMGVRPVPDVLTRITIDNDGDGQIDRIRLTFDQTLNDVFTGLTVTVAGHTVTGYGTGVTANDSAVDVLLGESGTGDTGATPAVQLTANTTLAGAVGGALVPVEGSATAATDAALPVLLEVAYADGAAVGVGADDRLVLNFSETVTVVAMTTVDLTLPVTGDTLGTTTIANQSGTVVTMDLTGAPVLTPVGIYSAAGLTAGSASGLFIATPAVISDAVGLNPLVGSPAAARDVTVGVPIHALVDLNGPAAGTGYSTTFLNQSPAIPAVAAGALTVSDSDQAHVVGATIILNGALDGTQETIDVTVSGAISKLWNVGTGTLTLTGGDTVAHYQAVLRTLTYHNGATVVTAGDRTITVAVDDGHGLGPVATAIVSVSYDTPPVASATTLLAAEGVAVQGTLQASDAEMSALTWEIVTPPTSGTLNLDATTGLASYVPVLGVTGDVTFTFRVFDGWSWSLPATATVHITPRLAALRPQIVSAPPRLGWLGDPLSYQVVVDVSTLAPGADLTFTVVGAPPGSTVVLTKSGATTATLVWTATGTPDEHRQLGLLVSDPVSGTSAFQPVQVLWRTPPGGSG